MTYDELAKYLSAVQKDRDNWRMHAQAVSKAADTHKAAEERLTLELADAHWKIARLRHQDIEHGHAIHDPKTGEWRWVDDGRSE